jgi:hypothetical protein
VFSAGYLGVQGVEPLIPQFSITTEPLVELCEGFRAQRVDPPLAFTANIDETGFAEHAEVPRDPRACDRQQVSELPSRCRTVPEGVEDRSPAFVGECVQQRVH